MAHGRRRGRLGGTPVRDLEDAANGADLARPSNPEDSNAAERAAQRAWHGGFQGAPPDTIYDDYLEDA